MADESTTLQVYVAERENSRYLTAFADDTLYVLEDVNGKVARTTVEAISSGGSVAGAFGDKAIAIPIDKVTKLTTAQHEDFVKVTYSRGAGEKTHSVAMDGHDEQIALMRSMAAAMSDATESEEPIPVLQAIIGPGLTSVGIIAVTLLFLALANDVASGNEIDTSGRRGGMKLLLANLLGTVGPAGVCAIGGLALAGALFWTYKRVQSPPVRTTIARSA